MEQFDFFNKLDTDEALISPDKVLSPDQIKLNVLLEEKSKLSEQIDRCPLCDGGEEYRCNQNHKQEWTRLLEEIQRLEDSIGV
jgi:hypothetical protein